VNGGRAQRNFATAIQCPQSFMGRIESGERGDGLELVAVAKALNVDRIDLFTRFVRT
jgi:hypothetical protein